MKLYRILIILLFSLPCFASEFGADILDAVAEKDYDKVVTVLKAGANPNAKFPSGKGPLAVALIREDNRIALELIKYKAEISDDMFESAVMNNRIDIVSSMIEHGRQINYQMSNGSTALHIACFHGYTKLTEVLVDLGADTKIKDKNGITPMSHIKERLSTFRKIGELLKSSNQ
jgi:ankyrin repeat protein